MTKTKYVFVILVYRNTSDLEECLQSIREKVKNSRSIVVNAYYDEDTAKTVFDISKCYQCDFLNIENKGYSYGNNRGIELAQSKYDFEYLIVSNPDIIIQEFNDQELAPGFKYDIIAPKIEAASGKPQNPMSITNSKISQYLQYQGFKKDSNILIYSGIALSKIINLFSLLIEKIKGRRIYPIYEAHGSFVILSKYTIDVLQPIYDENMFLFAEEGVLASKAKGKGLKCCYYPDIYIRHKEDGSMNLSNMSQNKELKKANIYCYEHYS